MVLLDWIHIFVSNRVFDQLSLILGVFWTRVAGPKERIVLFSLSEILFNEGSANGRNRGRGRGRQSYLTSRRSGAKHSQKFYCLGMVEDNSTGTSDYVQLLDENNLGMRKIELSSSASHYDVSDLDLI